jgi:hypothetical protein
MLVQGAPTVAGRAAVDGCQDEPWPGGNLQGAQPSARQNKVHADTADKYTVQVSATCRSTVLLAEELLHGMITCVIGG